MIYDFDKVVNRKNTNSKKWDPETLDEMFGESEALPFWVADMDFEVAKSIKDAVLKAAEHGIYGYSKRPDSYFDAIINWTKKRFDWEIKKEWIVYTPGIVPAVNYIIQGFCKKGDSILIQEPVYYPFARSIKNNGCNVENNPLKFNGEYYEIDFDDFETKVKDPKVKIFILCSPHNPISRVWTKDELKRLGKICLENNVLIVADEIHNDIVYPEHKHTIFGSLSEELAMNSIICTAPSKTFNLAGMQASNIIIPNEKYRKIYESILEKNSVGSQNPLSIAAVEAAYKYGEEWLEQLIDYLQSNVKLIEDHLKETLPKAKLINPQATYLGWIDLREYDTNGQDLERTISIEGKLALDGGTWFGQCGDGFVRINYACSKTLLKEGLFKLSNIINKKYK